MPLGFRLAPARNPGRVLGVLDLDVPPLVEPLFQQQALAEHLILFTRGLFGDYLGRGLGCWLGRPFGSPLGGSLGRSLGAGGPNGGGDEHEQECKDKTHGISIARMTVPQHSSIWAMANCGGRVPLVPFPAGRHTPRQQGARECPDMVPEGRID